jgi:hypothetical protein
MDMIPQQQLQDWTNGLNSSFALKLRFVRNLEFMAF